VCGRLNFRAASGSSRITGPQSIEIMGFTGPFAPGYTGSNLKNLHSTPRAAIGRETCAIPAGDKGGLEHANIGSEGQ
jgi:hypothetical protein